MADKQKTSAQDLYGTVPVESGGTGHDSVDETPTPESTKMVISGGVYKSLMKHEHVERNDLDDNFDFLLIIPNGKTINDIFAINIRIGETVSIKGLGSVYTNANSHLAINVDGIDASNQDIYSGKVLLMKVEPNYLYAKFELTKFNIGTGEATEVYKPDVNIDVYFM